MPVVDALDLHGGDQPILHADGRWWTRDALRAAIATAVAVLDEWDVQPGDRVAYLGANRAEALVLFFALARIGGVYVPLNTRLATTELAAILAHAEVRAVVVDDDYRAAASAAAGTTRIRDLAALRESVGNRPSTAIAIDPATPVLLAYTSGTTGAPKGAVHTQAGVLANARASITAHGFDEHDRVLTVLPLFHVGGLCIQTLPALLAGAQVVLHPRFDAGAWLAAITALRPTHTLMVPATLRAALAHPAWHATDLSCLHGIMAGSSTIPRALIDAVHARGIPLGQVYGATETGPVTAVLRPADAFAKPGFTGWPCFDDSIRIDGEADGDASDATRTGEVLVRAPNVMRGYWREAPETGFRDGWFATGDLGRRDRDGCIEIVGRSRDLIISGGENIHPAEVEDALLAIAGVAEVAVVGMPDERWGEVPAAFVVRQADTMLDEAAIAQAFEGRLARFKHPKRIVFVDNLPRNAMGKVKADVLRAQLAGRTIVGTPAVAN